PAAFGPQGDGIGDYGKSTRALGRDLQERGYRDQAEEALMNAYTELTVHGLSTRAAAGLTGIARSTAARRRRRSGPPVPREVVPANRLDCTERAHVLAVLNSAEFVDS